MAESAWWLGRMDESIQLYTDAYRLHLEAGDGEAAALVAVLLSIHTPAGRRGRAERRLG